MSHPTWVCGLKHHIVAKNTIDEKSHPTWVCGLKHTARCRLDGYASHTLRGCVD